MSQAAGSILCVHVLYIQVSAATDVFSIAILAVALLEGLMFGRITEHVVSLRPKPNHPGTIFGRTHIMTVSTRLVSCHILSTNLAAGLVGLQSHCIL